MLDIIRLGKIFELGAYPDRNLTVDEAIADRAIAAFQPLPADYEHTPGPLDGKLGRLTRVWREGTALFGEAEVPPWLDPLLAESGRKLSLSWDTQTNLINGWGWVKHPKITDAALFSAYATFNESETTMTKEEITALITETLDAHFNKEAGATTTKADPKDDPKATPKADPQDTPQTTGVSAAFSEEMQRLTREVASLRQTDLARQAETEVRTLVHQGRLAPTEALFAAQQLASALADDAAHPATFSVATQTNLSRAALLRQGWALRPVNPLLIEHADPSALFAAQNDARTAEERAKDYRTEEGSEAAARKFAEKMNARVQATRP